MMSVRGRIRMVIGKMAGIVPQTWQKETALRTGNIGIMLTALSGLHNSLRFE